MTKFKKILLPCAALSLAFCGESFAAGYSTGLYSASGLGNSYAGSVNGVHDVSDVFFNPAVTAGLDHNEFIISASYLKINVDSDSASGNIGGTPITGHDGHDAGVDAVIPALYLTTPITNSTAFNLAVTSPFGLATQYNQSWVGRYNAIESSITTININPSISHKLTDQFSVGFGLQAQYAQMTLTKAAPIGGNDYLGKLRGSDWGYGYNLGANFKLNDQWKFGAGYRSKIDYKITGHTRLVGLESNGFYSSFDAKTSTPESVTLGAAWQTNKKLELAYDVTWTRWSRVQSLTINAQNPALNDKSNFNWKDSFLHSVGANFTVNDKWLLRSGVAYEKDAVTNGNREPRVPNADKIWLSCGFNYKIKNGFSVDTSYMHQIYRTAQVHSYTDANNNFSTRYKTKTDIFSVALKKEF